jgi:hypothetical protein
VVAKVGTMSQGKTMAGFIHVSTMVTKENNFPICTVVTMVMRVYTDVCGESGDKLVYVSIV